jgi:alkanesulfonate monooxygenase SsuD/methylene tetrahydromethanopterin reductase-like flavin-dependent oxidoreductase (luciferase family)
MSLCLALAMATERIPLGTSITPIYFRSAGDLAQTAAFIHELARGRFRLGLGVSHAPALQRLGIKAGKPLADTRAYVRDFKGAQRVGELPKVTLAALRKKMIALAGEIADGIVFANGARSHMPDSLGALPPARLQEPEFFIGNMIPTIISDDVDAARARHRKTLTGYAMLPNYRNYWKEAGYVEEMEAIERALSAREFERVPELLTDRWLADVTLFGPARHVRDELERWYEAGVRTPILVPSSATGNQLDAFQELFAAFE